MRIIVYYHRSRIASHNEYDYYAIHIDIKQLYAANYEVYSVSRIRYSWTRILRYHSSGINYDAIYINSGLYLWNDKDNNII